MHALVARRVQLKKSGKNWTGCCPFHTEKSPSFYVYEDGFHCFGCGAHGDAITFVMQTQGATFIDAVESLAAEAGLEVPKQSPRAIEIEQERLGLHDILEAAQAEFVRQLNTPAGAGGLAYLRSRGLSDATIQRFGLGWSGDGRGSLTAALAKQGVDPARLEEAGLLRPQEDGPARELYWARVTFPIRDRRGRTISFGGRTLGDAKPKYINGPDTQLFHKKNTLYALDLAREGARKAPPIVVEGYMDVIALHQAGFTSAVAPLGTALAAEQLELLWRMGPMPVLCFDGDAAGARAAARVAELCLPLLTPERSLRLASLPGGKDPDDLVRQGGPASFQAIVDGARPLVDALFDVLREGGGETPEARAAFRARLDTAAARIADKGLSAEYRTALREKFFASRRPFGPGNKNAQGTRKPTTHRPTRVPPSPDAIQHERARCLTAILLRHPALVHDVEEAWCGLDLPTPLSRLRDAILHTEDLPTLDSDALLAHLHASGLADDIAVVLSASMPLPPSARPAAMPAEAEGEWWHLFVLMRGVSRLEEEVAHAALAYAERQDAATQQRLIGLRNAWLELVAIDTED